MKKPIESIKCLKGAHEICDYIKEDRNKFNELVELEGLPAWKRNEKGVWRALSTDLDNWLVLQRNKYLKERHKYIVKNPP